MPVRLLFEMPGEAGKDGIPSWAILVALVVVALVVGISVGLVVHARRRKENGSLLGGIDFHAKGTLEFRTGGQPVRKSAQTTRSAKRKPADE